MAEKNKSSVSGASSYLEIGEYWDQHDASVALDQSEPVEFTLDLDGERHYYSLEKDLSTRLESAARSRGVTPETLLNLWVQEKVTQFA